MIKKIFISFFALGFSGCLYRPAVSPKYDFGRVGEIHLKKINDHSNSFGSGEMIMSNLSHNFLKLGFDVKPLTKELLLNFLIVFISALSQKILVFI